MSYTVGPYDLSGIMLSESDLVTSILQNIAILLTTRKGTVPLYREFGLSQTFVDKPSPTVAKAIMLVEIQEGIMEFEPRAEFRGVSFSIDESDPGKLIPTVEVEIIEQ